jgi:hypothetical protein
MACLGLHFALSGDDLAKVLNAKTDQQVLYSMRDEIEQKWDEEWLYQTDKAWDAIHRCLADGTLSDKNGEYPLRLCVIGGKQLYSGDDYIISLKTPDEVADIAKALTFITKDALRQRYFQIDPRSYGVALSEEDFSCTWDYFSELPAFFAKAAAAKRPIVFMVDQ